MMLRVLIAGLACSAFFAATTYRPVAAEETANPVVVELFTSQGCHSCPPADSLLAGLNEIAEKHQLPIYCLSFHVDYWNSLGWKDPYSAKEYSQRQRRYAAAFESSSVYTPQMIVGGETEFVGSRARDAQEAIHSGLAAATTANIELQTSLSKDNGHAEIAYKVSGPKPQSLLNMALVQKNASNQIPRGENAGKQLAHVQVVRAFKTVALNSDSGTARLSVPAGLSGAELSVVAYVQDPQSMKILGAKSVDF